MKNKIEKVILIMVILFLGILNTRVEAKYTSTDPVVKSGEAITITIKSSEPLENYDLSLKSYDGLKYVSCSADNAAVNPSTGKISFATLGTGATTLGTYKFTAPEVKETTKYTVKFNINGTENSSTVTVNPKATPTPAQTTTTTEKPKEESATIESVVVNGIKIKQDLKVTNKENISVKVTSSNGEDITIYNSLTKKSYTAKSGKNTTVQVDEGTNTLTFTLSNGAKATRKIYSQKEEEVKPNTIEEEKEEIKLILKSLNIEALFEEDEVIELKLTPEFSPEVYEYTITIPEEQNNIDKLDIKAVGDKDNFKIEITGNENLVDGENIITITIKSEDTEKIATYIIKVIKEAKAVEAVTEPIEEEEIEEDDNSQGKRMLTIGLVSFTAVVAIAGIVFAVIEYKYGKTNKEDEFDTMPHSEVGFEKVEDVKENEDILTNVKENIDNDIEQNQEISDEEIEELRDVNESKIEEKLSIDDEPKTDNFIEDLYKKRNKNEGVDDIYNFNLKGKKKGKHF